MANCKECKENRVEVKTPENVPYIVHETAMARNERNVKRMIISIPSAAGSTTGKRQKMPCFGKCLRKRACIMKSTAWR